VAFARRHMPPPRTNFEKLQDILQKRKGLTLDVSSSGALAASLDKCIVRFISPLIADCGPIYHAIIGSPRTCLQHASAHHGNAVYAVGRVLLLRQRRTRYLRPLWSRKLHLHSFYESDQEICRYAPLPACSHPLTNFSPPHRCACPSPTLGSHRV
jgi:hypothetical protein